MLLVLVALLVFMIMDYKKFYIYLLAFSGIVLQLLSMYTFYPEILRPVISLSGGLVSVLLVFVIAMQRRKHDDWYNLHFYYCCVICFVLFQVSWKKFTIYFRCCLVFPWGFEDSGYCHILWHFGLFKGKLARFVSVDKFCYAFNKFHKAIWMCYIVLYCALLLSQQEKIAQKQNQNRL